MSLTHTEVKQTEISEFGAEKCFLRAMQGNEVAHALKRSPELPEGFWQSILRAKREWGVLWDL